MLIIPEALGRVEMGITLCYNRRDTAPEETRINLVADVAVKLPPHDQTTVLTNRLAWGVLLTAFALFGVLCIGSGLGVYYFLFKSTVPMQTVLTIGRGTSIVVEPNGDERPIRASVDINSRSMISTDSVGQAMLTFYDEQADGNRAIASVTMLSETSVDVQEIARPRFDWSTTGYTVLLAELSGRLEISIPNGELPAVELIIQTNDGSTIRLLESGRYSVTANQAQVRVEALEGTAEFTIAGSTRVLNSGERVMYDLNQAELVGLSPYVRLLGTSNFAETNVFSSNPSGDSSPWQCRDTASQPDNVSGNYGVVFEAGRPLLRFSRTGSQQHGETRCVTSPGGSGIDVTDYEYLSLEVLFRIDYQSLSGCGQVGTECPMMLQLDYVSIGDQGTGQWNHGFYLWNSQPNFPLTCSTCTPGHEVVNGEMWYRYRTDNLFAFITSPEQRPARILSLFVYAQGHEYETYVSEVSLYASEDIDPGPPVGDPSLQG